MISVALSIILVNFVLSSANIVKTDFSMMIRAAKSSEVILQITKHEKVDKLASSHLESVTVTSNCGLVKLLMKGQQSAFYNAKYCHDSNMKIISFESIDGLSGNILASNSSISPFVVDDKLNVGNNNNIFLSTFNAHTGGINLKANAIFPTAGTSDILYIYQNSSILSSHVMAYYLNAKTILQNFSIILSSWTPSEGTCTPLQITQSGSSGPFFVGNICLASGSPHYVYSIRPFYDASMDFKAPDDSITGYTVNSVFYPSTLKLSDYDNHAGGVYMYANKLFPTLPSTYICYLYYNVSSSSHVMRLYDNSAVVVTSFDVSVSAWYAPTVAPSMVPSKKPSVAPINTSSNSESSSSLSTPAIIGICFGSVIGLCLLLLSLFYFCFPKQDNQNNDFNRMEVVSEARTDSEIRKPLV